MTLVLIGRIGRPHGLEGEVALDGCDLTALELHAVKTFTWKRGASDPRTLRLETARPANTRMLVRFAGYEGRDHATELAGGDLLAERERIPDPGPGTAYTFQLLGLKVVTVDGRELGSVADVMPTAAHAVWVVRGERELLIPATPEVIKRVDLAGGVATVELPAGLEDL